MSVFRHLARVVAIPVLLVWLSGPGRAQMVTTVLSTLGNPASQEFALPYEGQAFIAGSSTDPLSLNDVVVQLDPSNPSDKNLTLQVYTNDPITSPPQSTVGVLGTNLNLMFSASTEDLTPGPNEYQVTFTISPTTPNTFTAGAGYWLILSDPTAGGVAWDYTQPPTLNNFMTSYNLPFEAGMTTPSMTLTSTDLTDPSQTTYYDPSNGAQLFQLDATSQQSGGTPEPSQILQALFLGTIVTLVGWRRYRARAAALTAA